MENDQSFWSVETDGNSYCDDQFNGTYEECIEYLRTYTKACPDVTPDQYQLVRRTEASDYCLDLVKGTDLAL